MRALAGVLLACCLPMASGPVRGETLGATTLQRGDSTPAPLCEDGVVVDDGSLETGYGFVPSVFEGQYLQRFDAEDLPTRDAESVCVCWLRTRSEDAIEYEVVFYEDRDGEPDFLPYASVSAAAEDVPQGIVGRFYEVDVSGVELREGPAWVGVRWDAGDPSFFFVCADHGPDDGQVFPASFSFDRGRNWFPVLENPDPIFAGHRSLLLRLLTRAPTPVEVPIQGLPARLLLVVALALTAVLLLGRRSGG